MPPTPEFVAWTLNHACALREDTDTSDPLATERQLRVLRSYADALAEQRCFDGICVNDSLDRGFRAADVLAAYGGEALLDSQCGCCPANTLLSRSPGNFAGCYGWLILSEERCRELTEIGGDHHLLWLEPTPNREALWRHAQLCQTLSERFPASFEHYAAYQQAIQVALTQSISLHWQLVPRGETDGLTWTIAAHCPRCRAPLASDIRYCQVCQYQGHPEPARRRKARGQRPYTPLATFLGDAGAAEFLRRYRASRGEVEL